MYSFLEKILSKTLWIFELRLVGINSNMGSVIFHGNVFLKGRPTVDIRKGCFLEIGSGVTLNSSNRGYHVNMYAPVKLFADRSGALIKIGSNTRIHGTCIHAYKLISIGENCLIAANCQILDANGHSLSMASPANRMVSDGYDEARPIYIGNNVWIGTGCVILPGVTIGDGSVIGANSVVAIDIPPGSIAMGNPAIIKSHRYK